MSDEKLRLKHDPKEDDPILGPIIDKIYEEARQKLLAEKGSLGLGSCHEIWRKQKAILQGMGIDWKTPGEMNPEVMFD